MTTHLRNLLTAVVCLFASIQVNAQFTAKVDQVPRNDWAPEPATFNMAEVAQKLGTDATTLIGALNEWMQAAEVTTNMFVYAAPSAPDVWTDAYTTGGEKGFWLDENAEVINYPDGAYYCNPVWDAEAGTFSINIGMMPDKLKYGVYNKMLNFALRYNDQLATFAVDFTVTGPDKVEIPEPTTIVEKELNVVGEVSVLVEQEPRNGYDSDPVYIKIDDLLAKLGIESGNIVKNGLADMLYTPLFDLDTVNKKDTLTNKSTAGAPGFWYTDIRVDGVATGECAVTNHGSDSKFYMESFAFNPETDTLSCRFGQMPGVLKGEEQFFVNIYLIYADKAYRVHYDFKVLVKEVGNGLEGYTKVGEQEVVVEQEPDNNYTTSSVRPDIEAISTALGCEIADLKMAALDDSNSFGGSTANNGGYWFSAEGLVTNWGANAALFVEPAESNDFSRLNVGQYPNALNVGDEVSAYLYFMNGQNYYAFTVKLKIVEPKIVEHQFENVATRTFTIQTLPSDTDYPIEQKYDMGTDLINTLIGTPDPALYGLAIEGEDQESKYSNSYSCDPKPGFWLNADGRVSTWGDANARVGICFADGVFQFFQYPGRNNLGDVFNTQLFLVNEDTGKMITCNISVAFVESIVAKEEVGSEVVNVPVTFDTKTVVIDAAKATEALGISVDDLLNPDNTYLRGLMSNGGYSDPTNCEDGLSFNMDGSYDPYGSIVVTIEKAGEDVVLSLFNTDTSANVAEDYSATGQFCIEVGEKMYVYYLKFMSESAFDGIETITAGVKNNGKVYDLSGRLIKQPAQGLYIRNGKKFIVK